MTNRSLVFYTGVQLLRACFWYFSIPVFLLFLYWLFMIRVPDDGMIYMHPKHMTPTFLKTYAKTDFIEQVYVSQPLDEPEAKGWICWARLRDGSYYPLVTHDRQTRVFRSLDAVHSAMRRAGLGSWMVDDETLSQVVSPIRAAEGSANVH